MKKLVITLSVLLVAACTPAPKADLAGLTAMTAAWQDAFDSRDAVALASLYAADGVMLPPNMEPVAGRANIRDFLAGMIATGLTGELEDVDIYANGDLGAKVGRYTLTDADGTVIDRGKYMEIWRNADGKWLMLRDIYNSSMPLPDPPAEASE